MNGADCGDERSDYELQRARSIRLNKEFLHSQQMVCSGYKISSFTFNSYRSQMSWMKLMLFWLPKSGGVGVMLQNQALIQWYQQLMMLASKAKEELYVERMAHVGNRLVEEKRVTLNRAAGLSKEDTIL